MTDLPGLAIKDFYEKKLKSKLYVHDQFGPKVEMPISMYFRNEVEMPELEDIALENCEGRVLDVGAGAGSHALALQVKGLDVSALEISPAACEVMESRGVKDVICADFFKFNSKEKYDTILLLMNGTGIFQSLKVIDIYLKKLHSLLNENGQILIDSTDILYMFDEDEDGGVYIPAEGYYGELDYIVHYKGESEDPIKWLYLDFNTLKNASENNGFKIEKILQEEDSYLARLTKK